MGWDGDYPDITFSYKWGGKDGKWRWLVEVGLWAQAGEERALQRAVDASAKAAEAHLDSMGILK